MAKVAEFVVLEDMAVLLASWKLRSGVKGGAEAAVPFPM